MKVITPLNEHPYTNYDSKTCPINQHGPVWFLPDVEPKGQSTTANVTFSCQIPLGKAIFFPISQSACWLNNPQFKQLYYYCLYYCCLSAEM